MKNMTSNNHYSDLDFLSSIKPYIIGLFFSLLFTLTAYIFTTKSLLTGWPLNLVLISCCLAQIVVQLLFFLHLQDEQKPRFNLLAFLFMLLVVAIVVIGSIWIIYHLNNRTMMPM